jgi:hypothetical protein
MYQEVTIVDQDRTMEAPIDYSRLIFAGIMGFLLFAELPDRYALVGAAMIIGSTLYIACREAHLSRMHRAVLAVRPIAAHPEDADAVRPRADASASDAVGPLPTAQFVAEPQPVFWRGSPQRTPRSPYAICSMIWRAKGSAWSSHVSAHYLRSDMDRHRIAAALGETRIFTTLHEAIAAARSGALEARPEK